MRRLRRAGLAACLQGGLAARKGAGLAPRAERNIVRLEVRRGPGARPRRANEPRSQPRSSRDLASSRVGSAGLRGFVSSSWVDQIFPRSISRSDRSPTEKRGQAILAPPRALDSEIKTFLASSARGHQIGRLSFALARPLARNPPIQKHHRTNPLLPPEPDSPRRPSLPSSPPTSLTPPPPPWDERRPNSRVEEKGARVYRCNPVPSPDL